MTIQESTKACKECNHILPMSDFHVFMRRKDGRRNRCKKCRNAIIRKRVKVWRDSPSGQKSRKRYQKRNKSKCAAREAVQFAVKKGKLPPVNTLKCATCGCDASEYHHHLGYAKEHYRDVQPLCKICHCAAHAEMKLIAAIGAT